MALEDIAGYSLRRKLGSGSAGTVWLVRDRASGRNAVLKRVPITAIPHPEELREHLAVLQRIDHPHIARLREVRETDTEWLLVSQYVVAGTLTALLKRRGPLSDGELVTLLSPLAEALDYLHRTGLTHGRVTPANVMFDADGRPVLTDPVLHTTHPTAASDDLAALAAVAHHSGGDPAVFTPDLFTTTRPQDLLSLTAPIPINLAFTQDPTPDDPIPTTPPQHPTNPASTDDPPTDDPPHLSRTPLTPPANNPSPPPRPQLTPPQPPAPKPIPRSTRSTRRKARLPNRSRRTFTPVNPLTRLTPSPPSTDHASTAASASAPPANSAEPIDSPDSQTADALLPNLPSTDAATSTSSAWGDGAPADRAGDAPKLMRPPRRSPLRRRRTWRRRSRRSEFRPAYRVLTAVGLAAVVVLILGLLTVGVLDNPAGTAAAADHTKQSPSPTPSPPSPTTPAPRPTTALPTTPADPSRADTAQWIRTLQALDAQRAKAFWSLDLALLDTIYVPGTTPWTADRALLATYRKHQIRVRGLELRIGRTTIESRTPTTVVLRTVDHLTAGQAITPSGTTTALPPGIPTTRRITLTTTSPATPHATSPWRITAITAA